MVGEASPIVAGLSIDEAIRFLHNMIDGGHVRHGLSSARREPSPLRRTVDKVFTYYALQFMARGGVLISTDGGTPRRLQGAWAWLCRPGQHVFFQESPRGRGWMHRYTAFEGPAAQGWNRQGLLDGDPLPIPRAGVDGFAQQFDALLDQSRRTDPLGRRRATHTLAGLLLSLAEWRQAAPGTRRDTAGVERPAWLDTALEAAADLTREPDYAALADRCHMALSTLRRKFRQATGQSLHAYRLDVRIAAARRLLGETDLPIKAVARQLGYRDVYFFSRQFAQTLGVPPGRFRASRQG